MGDLALKPLPGVTPNQMLKAIDKALVIGASMDGNLLREAAEAHHKAIGSIDEKLVTSASDFAGVNAALGKAIASVPTSQVMDVYPLIKDVDWSSDLSLKPLPGASANQVLKAIDKAAQ